METRRRMLLAIDAAINLLPGLSLVVVPPRQAIAALGLRVPATLFYVTVLGAVRCGIAVALWSRGSAWGGGLGRSGRWWSTRWVRGRCFPGCCAAGSTWRCAGG